VSSPHSSLVRGATALALFLAAACSDDLVTNPGADHFTPTKPGLALTGGAGVPIFPDAPPAASQPTGVAVGLNDAGQVAGSEIGLVTSDQDFMPFRWSAASGVVKLTGCCDTRWANDINDAGIVVGVAQTSQIAGNHAWVATGTTMTALPAIAGSDPFQSAGAMAINNAGQIAGVSPAAGAFALHAVIWSASGVVQDLGTLGGTNSTAIDINDAGQVIGSSQIAGNAATHFFLWSSGSGMQDLSTIIDPNVTSVVEINASGQIIGTYTTSGGASHAFLYTPGTGRRDLGTLGGTTSAPTGLNDDGDVVGSSTLADGSTHAFLWTASDGMEDITAQSGINDVRRLNDNLQTLTGARAPSTLPITGRLSPRLVQLQVTQSNAAPTAYFEWTCNGLTCTLDGRGSLDDKPGLTYSWDLNKYPDGSATGALVVVTYPHASQRTVTLTVRDPQGLTSTYTRTLNVTDGPIAAFTSSCTGLTCSFDSSNSSYGDETIAYRIWTWGDGQSLVSANALAPSHTYAQPGTYQVTLEVWDGAFTERGSLTKPVTVSAPAQNQAPVARFTFTCSNLTCSFDATGSTDDKGIVSYAWDLNKFPGGSASGSTVTATYPHGGTRNVTLTVTDASGLSSSITKSFDPGATATPADAPPVARFTSSCNGTVCTLDASSSTDDVGITRYDWSLGKAPDGSATGVTVTTDYWHTSTRTVTLTVTDTKGQTNSVTKTVNVP
jgi:probable HAF family extracellular repeat protein